jgi:hypothetical protein
MRTIDAKDMQMIQVFLKQIHMLFLFLGRAVKQLLGTQNVKLSSNTAERTKRLGDKENVKRARIEEKSEDSSQGDDDLVEPVTNYKVVYIFIFSTLPLRCKLTPKVSPIFL